MRRRVKVEEELKRTENLGIIENVTEPTEWGTPMVPVAKPSGKIRVCVDLKTKAYKEKKSFSPLWMTFFTGCGNWVLADSFGQEECPSRDVHYTSREILLQEATIWHNFGSRDFSKENV